MRVKFRTLSASAFGIIRVGDVVDVNDSEAKLLIDGGYAVPVDEPKEEAVVEGVEKKPATKKKGKKVE